MRSALDTISPPPAPPLPGNLAQGNLAASVGAPPPPSSSSFAYSPSLLIIAAILAFVIAASASIHLLLRLLSLSSSSSPSPSPLLPRASNSSSSSSSSSTSAAPPPSDRDPKALIDSLPLFTLASSLAAQPKSSPDCAVCLSPFRSDDRLRLLPACRHAFHAACIDAWLPSTPSCPLCRAPVVISAPPPAPQPDPPRTSSFRLEIGTVSRRRSFNGSDPPHARSYSLGSSFEYLVEDEVEAVVDRVHRAKYNAGDAAGPPAPGEDIAAEAGGSGRAWLRDYVERLASSASSSFSSLRFSSSRRFDAGGSGGDQQHRRESCDFEVGDEGGYYYAAFYKWLVGAPS